MFLKSLRFVVAMSLVCAGLLVGATGCKQKAKVDAKTSDAAWQLPGATNIASALNRQDFKAAVAFLMNTKAQIKTEEELGHFGVLVWEVKGRMQDAAPTNAQAAEALDVMRSLSSGRR